MPIIPFIPAIIGAAGSIGAAAINKSAANKLSGSQNMSAGPADLLKSPPITTNTPENTANFGDYKTMLDELTARGEQVGHFGKQERHAFRNTLDPAAGYWRGMLETNDPGKMASLFAPEINQINRGTQSAVQSAGEFGPRGGGTNSAVNNLQAQGTGQISDLFSRAKPLAAQNLAQIAPLYSSLSASEMGQSIGAAGTGANLGLTNALGQSQQALQAALGQRQGDIELALGQMWGDIQKRQQTLGAAGGLGSSLGGLLGLLLNKIPGAGGGGGIFGSTGGVTAGPAGGGNIGLGVPPPAGDVPPLPGGCCFIFLEALNGPLPWFVRELRDEYYVAEPRVAKGYIRTAKLLVPLMHRFALVKRLVNRWMVQPMIAHGAYLKGVSSEPRGERYKRFWFTVWRLIGRVR